MSSSFHTSERVRHLVVRVGGGEIIPDALVAILKQERVSCGWVRASGVLADVELHAYDGAMGALGKARRIAGPVHALVVEGSIGLVDGEPSLSLRALLARESETGLESLAGEVASAHATAFEAMVTSFDDLTLERVFDDRAGVWLLGAPSARPSSKGSTPSPAPWAVALEASERAEPAKPRVVSAAASTVAIPARPPRPELDLDAIVPERGDVVEHFAFGRCEVLKSDGDRLHLRVDKDGRIREIALEMLRVTPLGESESGGRRFKLERRL